MIASLTGPLVAKSPTEIMLDIGGIGYAVSIPLSTFNVLGAVNERVTLFTHLYVREDALQLFGFSTAEERNLFRLLISVSGIGPKIGQGLLSGMNAEELRTNIVGGRIESLIAIPGVGRKTAERIVLELRDKLAKTSLDAAPLQGPGPTPADVRAETLLALTSLGYSRLAAEKAIRTVLTDAPGTTFTVEELLKNVLKKM